MADFAKYLPFSQRRDVDESGVSGDRRHQTSQIVAQAADILAAAAQDPDTVDAARRGFLYDARLNPDAVDLIALAGTIDAGPPRRIAHLARATRALLALGDTLGVAVDLPAGVTGPVALYAATTTSFDRRAVLRGHTVRATDEDWAFGRGPVLEAPALTILRFVLALGEEPPRRPRT